MTKRKPDRSRTLEELENDSWGQVPSDAPRLARRCFELRRTPLRALAVEDLRLLLSQTMGVKHLLPEAVEVLCKNPLAEGELFPGDLLLAVLRLRDVWADHWELRKRLEAALNQTDLAARLKVKDLSAELDQQLETAIDRFTRE